MFYRQADGQKTICELRRDETECVMERERETGVKCRGCEWQREKVCVREREREKDGESIG